MGYQFNPITGQLDLVSQGGVLDGEVDTFADLPTSLAEAPVGSTFFVKNSSGVWLVNRRQSGIWLRQFDTGVRETDWTYGGDYPVTSVNGQTGSVTVAAAIHSHQPSAIYCDAVDVADTTLSSGEPNGIYFRDGSDNGKAIYKSSEGYAIWWDDGEEEWVLGNIPQTAKYFIGTGNTEYPWQATSWALGPQGSGDTPVVDQALLSNVQRNAAQDFVSTRTPKTGNASSTEVVLGSDTRLTNSRTPSSHSASHAAAGSDPLTPSAIGAQSIFATDSASAAVSGVPLQLSSARAKTWTLENVHSNRDVYLPVTGIQAGDVAVLIGGGNVTYTLTVKVPAAGGAAIIDPENTPSGSPVVISATGQQYRFIVTNPASFNPWRFVSVDTHTHPASAITSGTLDIARIPTGTSSTQVALGNHSHELTALAATGATNGHVLTANGSGGVTFSAASGGGVTTGSVDNAVLRANGTGGSTSQSSDLVIDDAVVAYAITGDASTDIITAVGHNYTANQAVRFQVLTGGSGLNNTTTYFVRDISGSTFKVSTTSGGAAVNFTTNITGGSVVAIQPNVALHLQKSVFSITADASTDIITATGHNFVNGDPVTFSSLVGGAGLDVITRYFVIDASANQLKVSTSAGGSAVNITTNYTDGVIELDVALVLGGNRLGALVLGNKPDGATLGGNPRGSGAVDLLQVRAQATQVASGTNAFQAGGRSNTASGLDAVVLGGNINTASAYLSGVICSANSTATGQSSVVLAGSTASATSNEGCLAIGVRALADRAQIIAQGCGQFASTGDAQRIHSVLRGKTTTNTAVELLTSTNTNQRLTCPSGKVMAMLINITGVKSDGSAVAHYVRQYAIKNVGGTTSEVYAPVTIGTDNAASTSIAVEANDTNDALRINVTGIASETWRWVASVDAVEVAYGT